MASSQPTAEELSYDPLNHVSVNFREPLFTALMQIVQRVLSPNIAPVRARQQIGPIA